MSFLSQDCWHAISNLTFELVLPVCCLTSCHDERCFGSAKCGTRGKYNAGKIYAGKIETCPMMEEVVRAWMSSWTSASTMADTYTGELKMVASYKAASSQPAGPERSFRGSSQLRIVASQRGGGWLYESMLETRSTTAMGDNERRAVPRHPGPSWQRWSSIQHIRCKRGLAAASE